MSAEKDLWELNFASSKSFLSFVWFFLNLNLFSALTLQCRPMRKTIAAAFILVFTGLTAYPQYFATGEDPAGIKWRQINTENFQLIFPDDFESKAQVLANYFEMVYQHGSKTLDHNPRKISVLFHTHTVRSNGLVGWAPRRMELFTPPHQEIYAQDWLQQLAIHEFRHVIQIDKIHQQLPSLLKILFGEQISALVTGAYLPFWLIEGDAVMAETALSNHGRGRLPSFLMEHKAQIVEKGVFSFDKAFNGSYKHYVPDHYKLGYLLSGEIRAKYGADIWNSVLDNVSRKPLSLTPVNRMLRTKTGMNQEGLYRSILDSLAQIWTSDDFRYNDEIYRTVSRPSENYANYQYIHVLPDGNIVALKTTYEKISQFIQIDETGNEKYLLTPGQIFSESVGYQDNLIVWSEYVPDPRWSHRGKSQIRFYDISSHKQWEFFPEYTCYAPVISPDKHNVAIVEVNFVNDFYISVYNITTGKLIHRYQSPTNHYFFSPVWLDNEQLISIILENEGKMLARINPAKGTMDIIPRMDQGEIKQLRINSDTLYYISGHSGKDELYRASLNGDTCERIGEARFGFAYPALNRVKGEWMVSDYTSNGYRIIGIDPRKTTIKPLSQIEPGTYKLADKLAKQEESIINFTLYDTIMYSSKPYRKIQNLFHFHSWGPFVANANTYEITPGFSLLSQNKLGTSTASVGYDWIQNEKRGEYFISWEYRGWYPIISLDARTGNRAGKYYEITNYENSQGEIVRRDTVLRSFTYSRNQFSATTFIPLNFTRGAYFRLFQPEFRYGLMSYGHHASTPENFISGNLHTLSYRLYFHQIRRKAPSDLLANFGWIVDAGYSHSPGGNHNTGSVSAIQLRTYLPGIKSNHGTSLYSGMQVKESGRNQGFSDILRMPRGIHPIQHREMSLLSADYRLPLFYPEFNAGRWVYIRRIKAMLWGDYSFVKGDYYQEGRIAGKFGKEFYSVGMDLSVDLNYLRLYAPASTGIRTIYLPQSQKWSFELLFSIDFTSF